MIRLFLQEGEELFSPKHSESEYYLLSLYGRLNYAFTNKYMVTATLRADASSRFAKGNRWGYFPSVALGWKLSEEKFLKNSKVLTNLKLRLSYGLTGQQDIINDYPYMTTFSVSYPSPAIFLVINGTIPIAQTDMIETLNGRLQRLGMLVLTMVFLTTASMVRSMFTSAIPRIC